MPWCLPRFDDGTNTNTSYDLFTWQAHHMSNYLRHLPTKQLDITTNPEKPEKRVICAALVFSSNLKRGGR